MQFAWDVAADPSVHIDDSIGAFGPIVVKDN